MDGGIPAGSLLDCELLERFENLLEREIESAPSEPAKEIEMDSGIPAGGLRDLPTQQDRESRLYERLLEAQERRIEEQQKLYERLLVERERRGEAQAAVVMMRERADMTRERLSRYELAEAAEQRLKAEQQKRERLWGTVLKGLGTIFGMMLARCPDVDFDDANSLTEMFTHDMADDEVMFKDVCSAIVAAACALVGWEAPVPDPVSDTPDASTPTNQQEQIKEYEALLAFRRAAFDEVVRPQLKRIRLPVGERGVTNARQMLNNMKRLAFEKKTFTGTGQEVSEMLVGRTDSLALAGLELLRRSAPWLIERAGLEFTLRFDELWNRALMEM